MGCCSFLHYPRAERLCSRVPGTATSIDDRQMKFERTAGQDNTFWLSDCVKDKNHILFDQKEKLFLLVLLILILCPHFYSECNKIPA